MKSLKNKMSDGYIKDRTLVPKSPKFWVWNIVGKVMKSLKKR